MLSSTSRQVPMLTEEPEVGYKLMDSIVTTEEAASSFLIVSASR